MFLNNQSDHNDDTNSGAVGCLILLFFGIGAFGGVVFIMKCFIDLFTGKA